MHATTDPYNYPSLQKTQTMYLSTISNSILTKANKTSSPPNPILCATPHSREMILLGQLLKSGFLQPNVTQALVCQLL